MLPEELFRIHKQLHSIVLQHVFDSLVLYIYMLSNIYLITQQNLDHNKICLTCHRFLCVREKNHICIFLCGFVLFFSYQMQPKASGIGVFPPSGETSLGLIFAVLCQLIILTNPLLFLRPRMTSKSPFALVIIGSS